MIKSVVKSGSLHSDLVLCIARHRKVLRSRFVPILHLPQRGGPDPYVRLPARWANGHPSPTAGLGATSGSELKMLDSHGLFCSHVVRSKFDACCMSLTVRSTGLDRLLRLNDVLNGILA